jgi:hypothetical protein
MWYLCAMGAFAALAGAGAALADPQILSDAQLANVAAGYYETSPSNRDAIVVGNASGADVHTLAVVGLSDGSQEGSRAVTLVNAAGSSVAIGGNLLDGREPAAIGGSGSAVGQSNRVLQDRPVAAYVADWQVHGVNVVSHKTETTDSAFTGRITPATFEFGGSKTRTDTTTDNNKDPPVTTTDRTTTPITRQVKIGRGVAFAGSVDVVGTAGQIGFSEFSVLDTTFTITTKFEWDGIIFDFTIEDKKTFSLHEEASVSGSVTLQPFSLRAEGVVCQALVGSCQVDAGRHSKASQGQETVLHPARMQGASAEHIVMSDGRLQHDKESRVRLEGDAQRGVAALHVANAGATALANGVNVAAGAALSQATVLRQVNAITQRR